MMKRSWMFLALLPGLLLELGCKSAGQPTPPEGGAVMRERYPALETRASGLEVVARLETPPGNIAITPGGRIFLSQHPFGAPPHAVVELLPGGATRPYPPEASRAPGADGVGLLTVIGLEADRLGVLWLLDNGKGAGVGAKLVAWDTQAERLVRTYSLGPPAAVPNSFIQDLVVDPDQGVAVLADMGRGDLIGQNMPGLIVVDLKSGRSRRVLEGHPSLNPEEVPMVVDGRTITVSDPQGTPVQPRLGLNPIALDPSNEWVYYGSMNGQTVWRARLKDLADPALSAEELGKRVERYGQKAVSDGISIDSAGNIYVTDLGANAIGVTSPHGKYRPVVQDSLLSWPDGLSYGPDGFFYVTVNQLHRHAVLNGGTAATQPPFLVVRFRPLAPSAVGR